MRGGTSKGLIFLAKDLPGSIELRDQILLSAMGSPDPRQIDGVGGGNSLTSKVAIVGRTTRSDSDIECLFAQVMVDRAIVDTTPNCGNILSAVAPFAIEEGLVKAGPKETLVRIFSVNTQSVVEIVVQTPGGKVTYEGDTQIDGVPGTAAPIRVDFYNTLGSKTGKLLPTGRVRDVIEGISVSCVDMAIPMVLISAQDLGKTGYESKAQLDADKELLKKIEVIRRQASLMMKLGEAKDQVIPKISLLAHPQYGSGISSRYFTPDKCHDAHAVTGAICIAVATGIKGSVAEELFKQELRKQGNVRIEHPSGFLDVSLEVSGSGENMKIKRAALIRTARRLFEGHVFVNAAQEARLKKAS